ncbi:MAG: DeoR/GlpR transcriptional regulator [Rhodobacteraceae bacterium]|nr:DeoR/GlpR transcriptional regulator [Paracoccaceae bacterium]
MTSSRWQTPILDRVRSAGSASIAALAAELKVSGETIRRHVRPLVDEGVLTRSHGGVTLAKGAEEPPFARRMGAQAEAKRAIALAAAGRVPDGATLMIDTGSTTAYVAEILALRRGLTVITNSIEIARRLAGRNGHRVYIAGGEIRPDLSATVGAEALAFVAQFRADLAILSVGAIDAAHGYLDFHLDETRVARAMLDASRSAMVVADASKFGTRAAVPVCALTAVACLVTDAAPPPPIAARLKAAGAAVVVATGRNG